MARYARCGACRCLYPRGPLLCPCLPSQDFDQDANNAIDCAEFQKGFMRRGVVLLDEEAHSLVRGAPSAGPLLH